MNLICYWSPNYLNSLEDIFLKATFYRGFPRLPGFSPSHYEARQLKGLKYGYELIRPPYHDYVGKDEKGREFTPEQLADHLLQTLIDLAEKNPPD